MRPDGFIVGELHGAEALNVPQAMNAGHDGSLTAVHTKTPQGAVSRLEMTVAPARRQQGPMK